MHRLDGGVVEKHDLPVVHDVSVAPVERGLYLHGRDLAPHRVECVRDVERTARRVAHGHDGNDGRHGVSELHQLVREVDPPSTPPQRREPRAEEVEHLLRVYEIEAQVAFPVALLEAPLLHGRHRLALGLHGPYAPHERIVGVGEVHGPRTLHRARGELYVAVVRVEFDGKRRAGALHEGEELRLRLDFDELLLDRRVLFPVCAGTSRPLRLDIVHFTDGNDEAYRDDVHADHAVAAVRVAGAVRLDLPAGLQREGDRHVPSARLRYLAAYLERVVIVRRLYDVSGVYDRKRLVEDFRSAPLLYFIAS